MRLNQFIARATGLSRRAADAVIVEQRVRINDQFAQLGQAVSDADTVTLDGQPLHAKSEAQTIMLNKPVGYVVSRDGQGSQTIYDLLPTELHDLKPVGRLDKNSSGLLLLTNDGQLAQRLTHPEFEKVKIYKIVLNKDLLEQDFNKITKQGVELEDGTSKFEVLGSRFELKTTETLHLEPRTYLVRMHEGRNRQIRRTFEALGYKVVKLHRTQFGAYELGALARGKWHAVDGAEVH